MTEYSESAEIAAELSLEDVGQGAPPWFVGVAFTTLVLSMLTAAAALLAGITAHETLIDRTEEIIDLSRAESDRVTAEILTAKHETLAALGVSIDPEEVALVKAIDAESARLEAQGDVAEAAALSATNSHLIAAIAATILALSIAVTGLSAVVRQRWLWFAGGAVGLVACAPLAIVVAGFFG